MNKIKDKKIANPFFIFFFIFLKTRWSVCGFRRANVSLITLPTSADIPLTLKDVQLQNKCAPMIAPMTTNNSTSSMRTLYPMSFNSISVRVIAWYI